MNVPANLATPENLPFSRLGPYRIDRRVGQGGMGDVYLGYEEALDRPVAIKVLPPELARNADFIQRFRTEAAAVAKLSHPNVVPIYAVGKDAEHHYFAMQYVEGEALDRLLDRHGRLGVGQVLFILEQVLGGLEAIHRAGLIHRDIKPANILIEGKSQRVLVADFGLAKSTAAAGMTATGVVVGTVDYLSPEQARGQKTDQRADLYSLGVLVFQMLSGRLPFEAETPSGMMFQHAYEKPLSLQALAPDVPTGLTVIVEKLMVKTPAERYQSCAEVLAALRRSRSSVSVGIAPPDKRQTVSAQPSQSAPIRFEEELASLAWESASTRSWWTGLRQRLRDYMRAYTPEIIQSLQTTGQQVDGAVAEHEQRRDQLAQLLAETREAAAELTAQARNHRTAAREAAQRAERTPQSDDRHSALREKEESERTAADLEEQVSQQQEQIGALEARFAQVDTTLLKLRNQRDVLNARLRVAQARLDIEGVRKPLRRRRLGIAAVLGAAVTLGLVYGFVALTGSGRESKTLEEPEKVVEKPSDSGDRVAAANSIPIEKNGKPNPTKRVDSIPVTERPLPRREFPAVTIKPETLNFKPGDPISPLALLQNPPALPGVRSWTLETTASRSGVGKAVFSSDGKWMAIGSGDGAIRLYHAADGRLSRMLLGHVGPVTCLDWSPDGSILASGSNDKTIRLWQVTSGRLLRTFRGTAKIGCLAYSPDNRTLASADNGGRDRGILLWDVAEGKLQKSHPSESWVYSMSWSPDGSTLAMTGQNTIWLLSPTGGNLRSLEGHTISGVRVAWSPDGKTLVSGGLDNTIRLWKPETGESLGMLEGTTDQVLDVAWSPDGQSIAGGLTKMIRIWDAKSRQILRTFPTSSVNVRRLAATVTWSADSRFLVTSGDDNAYFWNASSGQLLRTFQGQAVGGTRSAWSPDGKMLATIDTSSSTRRQHTVDVWVITNGKKSHSFGLPGVLFREASWAPNGKILALSSCLDNVVRLWTLESDQLLHELKDSTNSQVFGVSWSPDGKKLLSTGDKNLALWDPETGKLLNTLSEIASERNLWGGWSPVGGGLITVSNNALIQWDDTGKMTEKATLPFGAGYSIAWAPDGTILARGGSNGIVFWDVKKNKFAGNLSGAMGFVLALAWSPNGKMLAAAGDNSTVWLWEVASGQSVRTFQGHSYFANSLAWSPDGKTLMTGSSDGMVRFWDVDGGRPLGLLQPLPDDQYLILSADGHFRGSPRIEENVVYVVLTDEGQQTLTPAEFARKYGWKNDPGLARLLER